jgi:peptidoglycan/LPS O-acetylase OafA/YrhL
MSEEDKEIYYRTYFGQSHDYYYDKLEQYQAGRKVTFNFYAFFLGLPWLLYRKMNRFALFLLVAVVAQSILLNYMLEQKVISATNAFWFERGAMLIWGLVTGFLANYFYMRQAQREVDKAIAATPNEDTALELLSQKGGVTFIPHIVIAVMLLVLLLMGQ